MGGSTSYQWDVFISHAGEDKESLVRPLAAKLQQDGIRVWYDEHSLKWGDSLRESIDEGLSTSAYGIVVLSSAFFAKPWPRKELNALFALESDGRRRLLPVWHGVTHAEVSEFSPLLADIRAVDSSNGIRALADELFELLQYRGQLPIEAYGQFIEGETIDVVALARGLGGVLKDIYFKNCRLVGPAVLFPIDSCAFVGLRFGGEVFWVIDPGRPYAGAIGLQGCRLEEVEFDGVGIAATADFVNRFVMGSLQPPDDDG